ncbi:MAG: AI-2E family transporter [Ignavibacteria bacterium]|jgi:predicted PurR-regulated permease PerM
MPEVKFRRPIKLILLIISIIIGLYVLFLVSNLIIILALSTLLAFIFIPFIYSLEGQGFTRLTSTLIVFAAMAVLIYLGLSVVIPKFSYQMDQLIQRLSEFSYIDQIKILQSWLTDTLPFIDTSNLSARIEEFVSTQIVNSFESISTLLSSIVSVIAILVIVPFITFFLLKDSKRILKGLLSIMPNNYFEMSYWILKKVSLQLGLFVRAWIFDATFVGTLLGFGFYIIGIPSALPLGVIAGLGHLIPYFGPIIGAIPAIILSLMQTGDLSQVPLIIIVVLGVYTIDNGFVQPYVFGKSVDIHPILIILLIIGGGQIFGLIGMLLAVPVATVIKTSVMEIYFALKNYKIVRV